MKKGIYAFHQVQICGREQIELIKSPAIIKFTVSEHPDISERLEYCFYFVT